MKPNYQPKNELENMRCSKTTNLSTHLYSVALAQEEQTNKQFQICIDK